MKRLLLACLITFIPQLLFGQLLPNLGGQRVGISAAQFLKIAVGARGVGMGESYVAVANDVEALYYNPAGIALFDETSAFFAHNQWLVDIQLEYAGLAFHLNDANSFGAAITYLHTEEMMETTEFQPFGTGRFFNFSDFLISLSYARNMTDQFSFGISVKFMQESIAELAMRGLLIDLGTYYKTGWGSTRVAVTMSNFGTNMTPGGSFSFQNLNNETVEVNSFQSFAPPTVFRIGIAGEIIDNELHRITTAVQLNHPNDNAENINLGGEYGWKQIFALRVGYKTAQAEENFSAGFGVHFPISMADFKLDYAFTDFGRLGNVNRFSLQLQF